jgi:hypothetical protein
LTYFALGFDQHTSYVAERLGGGPHDLLGGFDSFRNCKKKRGAAMPVPKKRPAVPVPKNSDCFYGNNG